MILRRRTNNHLPDEIVLEILARLPVKPVLRLRCVCKSWYSYITNSNFISTHLNHNHHHDDYVIHKPKPFPYHPSSRSNLQVCTLAFDRTFETISEFRIPFNFPSGYPGLVGSCNGILCFTDFITSNPKDVYLWNPSIRKFKRLPNTCLTQLSNVALGFGYDSQNNDYKVVRISLSTVKRPKPMPLPDVEVYSLSSDSWKRVGFGISWRPNVVFRKFNCTLKFPFVIGHLHWTIEMIEEGGGQETRFTSMILSFDVNSEKFKELPLPDDEGSFIVTKCVSSFKGKLALIKFGSGLQPHSMLCSIWVMKEYGVLDSWNKLYVVPVDGFIGFAGFTNYGTFLFQNMPRLVSTNSELERKYKSVLIDPETLHENEISIQVKYNLDVATYMESLA
ncbi:F-box/kelch-repeat protein At3g23880-like isoform X3 [Quercus robur]|uniref:F-box/kelch-repeat protein At3g23880-like isoform X3 n=1 Tax=Quercus robur TaxID=38942 RepID=UPI002162550A|nr:F-box/kelch-repeat protein At3g23880-like isoform X3 [Quercus robur]